MSNSRAPVHAGMETEAIVDHKKQLETLAGLSLRTAGGGTAGGFQPAGDSVRSGPILTTSPDRKINTDRNPNSYV